MVTVLNRGVTVLVSVCDVCIACAAYALRPLAESLCHLNHPLNVRVTYPAVDALVFWTPPRCRTWLPTSCIRVSARYIASYFWRFCGPRVCWTARLHVVKQDRPYYVSDISIVQGPV